MTTIDPLQWSSSCLVYSVEIKKVVGCLLSLKAVQTLQLCFFPHATLGGPLRFIYDILESLSHTCSLLLPAIKYSQQDASTP